MKKIEWLIASLFIVIGLHCLVMAGVLLPGTANISSYLIFLLCVCFWMGIPILIGFIVYIIVMKINKQKGKTL